MTGEKLEAMKKELERWQTRLGEFRVKAHLTRMEAHDKLDEFERAYLSAKDGLAEVRRKGKVEWKAVTSAIESGWEELRGTYQEIKKKQRGP